MDNSLIVDGLNIAQLSDDELSERLQNLGFIPGPILATTRSVYQRKLARLLRNEELEDLETNDDSSHSVTSPPRPVLNSTFQSSSPSSFNYDELRRRPLPRVGENWSDGPPVLSPHKPWSIDDIVTRAPPPPTVAAAPEKFAISPTVMIIGVASLLLFAFFVYYNMESTPTNPFQTNKKHNR
ncbi:hypothetical protein X975_10342, partial [Stegodyphus mimosarum]